MRIYITSWKRGHDALSINKIESVIKCVGFPCGSAVKESACNAGDLVRSLGWEDPLEKGQATHSRILAWRMPWTIQTAGLQRVRHD